MLDLDKSSTTPTPKCLFTSTQMAKFLDHEQPPIKKRPLSTILNQPFTHTACYLPLDILLPKTTNLTPLQSLATTYAKLHLKLLDLLSDPFFTTYIKTPGPSSDILLISEPPSNDDSSFSLADGILRMELGRPTYEKTGLQGKPIPPSGEARKHTKQKFLVEVNLRLPSMVHGKPAFERLLWACKNVLNESVTWLFYCPCSDQEGPIKAHSPTWRTTQLLFTEMSDVLVPELRTENEDEAVELLEWVSLAMNLCSPRIQRDDKIDPYLSRYQVPQPTATRDLFRFRWRGLISPGIAQKTFLTALKCTGNEWMAMSGTSFTGRSYTILVRDGKALTWEYKD
ncbi:Hypothetical predicted protein [Lecanosticta acicola]|uniref:Uncharacterized protein n=1 Tax=Lecanosticta acicola TaxID=111012 RepID=A0AAI8Z7P5_9PEZI|nr:Hypothetical predicted protein [Lecanosticta acicola]